MGIYFMAAGNSSNNRIFTLETPWKVADFDPFLSRPDYTLLQQHFPKTNPDVYLWGANSLKRHRLNLVLNDEYVVDLNSAIVPYIFQFCFVVHLPNQRLQHHVRWDSGRKSTQNIRHYEYVYFLKNRRAPRARTKAYFLDAFGNAQGLRHFNEQRYVDLHEVVEAMKRKQAGTIEDLLGL